MTLKEVVDEQRQEILRTQDDLVEWGRDEVGESGWT